MRSAGLTAICFSIVMTGIYYMNIRKKKLEYIRAVSDFFREFAYLITLNECDAAECVKKLSEKPGMNILGFLGNINNSYVNGCNFRKLWLDALSDSKKRCFCHNEVYKLLVAFADSFGKYSGGEFSEKCIVYSKKAMEIYDEEKAVWEKNRTLYMGTGIFTAAAVFIIFI